MGGSRVRGWIGAGEEGKGEGGTMAKPGYFRNVGFNDGIDITLHVSQSCPPFAPARLTSKVTCGV